MIYFNADPRDAYATGGNVCGACCCQPIGIAPNEDNKVTIGYAPWAAPLGGNHGLQNGTQFSIEKKAGQEPEGAPDNTNYRIATTVGVSATIDVSDNATSPTSAIMTFGLVPLSGPSNGEAVLDSDGALVYTPNDGFVGYDSLYFTTSDGDYTIVRQIVIKVSKTSPAPVLADKPFDPVLRIDPKTVNLKPGYNMSFQLSASPAARVGDVYRLTIKQPALDCDCNEYNHVSCYDITITKC